MLATAQKRSHVPIARGVIVVGALAGALVVDKLALVRVARRAPMKQTDAISLVIFEIAYILIAVVKYQLALAVPLALPKLALVDVAIVVRVHTAAVPQTFEKLTLILVAIQILVYTFASSCVIFELAFIYFTIYRRRKRQQQNRIDEKNN
jgi:hypothetical protein